jgi:multidrug resistance efflux pump
MAAGLAAAALVAVLVVSALTGAEVAEETPANLIGAVRRGPMTISVTERAEVEAERKKSITNELQWSVIIKEVVPDGTLVQEGDLIIEFECKELEDAIARQKLDLASAENAHLDAVEKLKMTSEQTANKVVKAEAALLEAEANLGRYTEGAWPVQKNDAESAVTLAQKDLALVQQDLDFMLKANEMPELKDNQPYSDKQIEAKELEVDRARLSLSKAKSNLDMLIKYDDPKERRRLKMAFRDAELDLKVAKMEQNSELRRTEGSLQTAKSRLDTTQQELDKMLADAEKLKITADRAGLVIYKTTRHHWQTSDVVVAAGETINRRQQLMIIPDMTSIRIRTNVGESIINQVQPGLAAYVKLDALPGRTFRGTVARVNPVADPQGRWDGNERTYTVMIRVEDREFSTLKPDMTGEAEIILARVDDAIYCPIAGVFSEGDESFAWRLVDGRWVQTPVDVGRVNQSSVEILDGLASGDQVRLAPPPGYKAKVRDKEEESPEPELPAVEETVADDPQATKPAEGRPQRQQRGAGQDSGGVARRAAQAATSRPTGAGT